MIGPFDVEFIPVTHSVPHAHAIAIHTPQGVILHSGDFKLDLTPVDGRRTDLARIGSIASNEGIRLLLADSTNAEEHGHAPSETSVGAVLRALFAEQRGQRIITASFASHLHRIQQIADAAIAEGRVVATLGLSMKKNVRMGRDLGVVDDPRQVAGRHRRHRQLPAGQGVRDLHRFAGRADVGAGPAGSRREQVGQDRRDRHRDPVEPRHPRQREQRQSGHRRIAAGRCAGHPLRRRRRSRHRPRAGRRAEDVPLARPSPSSSCRSTASTATWSPTPSSATSWACRTTTCWSARTATC